MYFLLWVQNKDSPLTVCALRRPSLSLRLAVEISESSQLGSPGWHGSRSTRGWDQHWGRAPPSLRGAWQAPHTVLLPPLAVRLGGPAGRSRGCSPAGFLITPQSGQGSPCLVKPGKGFPSCSPSLFLGGVEEASSCAH